MGKNRVEATYLWRHFMISFKLAHWHSHTLSLSHTHTRTLTLTHTHARTHARRHVNTRTYTRKHTHNQKHPAAHVCAKMREPCPCCALYVSLTPKYYDVTTTTTTTQHFTWFYSNTVRKNCPNQKQFAIRIIKLPWSKLITTPLQCKLAQLNVKEM